jgi:hypothetical protein
MPPNIPTTFPPLICLLSVDIVGSAEFKARATRQGGPQTWVSAFKSFYTLIPELLDQELRQRQHICSLPAVQIWKAIGDQLVFLCRPASASALEQVCLAFLRAMGTGGCQLEQQWGFRLHGVAWAFEENAANVTFQFSDRQLNGALGFDLIGPDVDLGFRLVGLAPAGDLLVPLEMRALLPLTALQIALIGEASLKGIPLDPYPLLKLQER